MRVHVAARNAEYAKKFEKNNPGITNLSITVGSKSLFHLLQCVIDGDDDYALFVHDDVFIPSEMNSYVAELIDTLDREWPNWGLCGNAGIVVPSLAGGARACRYLFDPHGGPSGGGYILPAETIDGNSMLINCRAMRAAGLQMPKFEGFQFYDISLSIETLSSGLAVLVAPQLACYHDSRGNQSEFDRAAASPSLMHYLSSKLCNRFLSTLNGSLRIPLKEIGAEQFDICNTALLNACQGRADAKIAFVIRSQFRNMSLLKRAIESTLAFAASTSNKSIKTYVITDKNDDNPLIGTDIFGRITILPISELPKGDTRNYLIREAVKCVTEDFVLFLDDDDWVFPNESEYISRLLTCLPASTSLVVDSQHFSEGIKVPGENDWRNSSVRPQRRFNGADWILNFSGNNYIPMCGAFYSRQILADQPMETYEKITFSEDYAVSLFALLNKNSNFFSAPKLISGISIREPDVDIANTVTALDRTKWKQSQAELAHQLSLNTSNNIAFLLGRELATCKANHGHGSIIVQGNVHLSRIDRVSLACSRTIHGAILFVASPRYYAANLRRYVRVSRQRGFRGLIRSIADTRDTRIRTQ